jgi:nucleolar complex protein 3
MKNSPLLPAVLEGLAVFSHLINIDLLSNLLDVLKELILKNQLSVASSMHCIVTAFQTLKLQGDALDIDLKEFYAHFYGLLIPIMTSMSEHGTLIPLACKALELMMFNKRMYDMERVAAYVKRLLTVASGLPPHSCMAICKVVFDLLRVCFR